MIDRRGRRRRAVSTRRSCSALRDARASADSAPWRPIDAALAQAVAEVGEGDHVAPRDDARALQSALELGDVARPGVLDEPPHRGVVDAADAAVQLLVEALDEVRHERRDVLATLAQRLQAEA